MADPPVFSSETTPSLQQLIDYLVDSVFDGKRIGQLEAAVRNAAAEGQTISAGAMWKAAVDGLDFVVDKAEGFEQKVETVVAPFLARIVAHMLGIEVPNSALREGLRNGQGGAVGQALAKTLFAAIETDEADLTPGDAGARRLVAMSSQLVLQTWFEGILFDEILDLIPGVEAVEGVAELGHQLADALGLGRMVRAALRPLIDVSVAKPLEWQQFKLHRPTLLSAATAVRQVARGKWDAAKLNEELARLGYSNDRIEALVNEQSKFLTTDDLAWMVWQELIGVPDAVQTMRDQGYDEQTASKHINIQSLKRDDAIHREVAAAATAAYVDGRIDDGDLTGLLAATIPAAHERDLLVDAARAKRQLRAVHLSPAEAKDCVIAGIVPMADYRAALERAGYVPDAVDALELLLRSQIDKTTRAADVKAQQAKAQADAAKAKADAAAAAKAKIDAAAALKRRGSLNVLEDAAIRGLVPLARLQEVLTAEFDPDTVAIYTADVESKRAAYVATQQKADAAAKRAGNAGLSVSELQTALVDGVLTIDQVRQQLTDRGLAPADVSVLVQTMQIAAQQHAAAAALHAQAAQRAQSKPLTLAQADALMRAGHWTLAQYNAFLTSIDYGDGEIADLDQLINDRISKDAAARALRTSTTAANPARGLSLEQFRSAVILGIKPIDDYAPFLLSQGFTADATATLVAELADAVDTANAARARRAAAASAQDGRAVPLSDLTRAAQLGIMSPTDYQAALVARGYSADAAALELDLLTTEIAAKRGLQPAPDSADAAVADAASSGATLATARHVTIDGELALRGLSLADTETAAKNGLITLDAYQSWLEQNGYGQADAELLRALLATKIGQAGA